MEILRKVATVIKRRYDSCTSSTNFFVAKGLFLVKIFYWENFRMFSSYRTLAVCATRVCRGKTKNPWERASSFELPQEGVSLTPRICVVWMKIFFLFTPVIFLCDVINFSAPSVSHSQPSSTLSSFASPTHTYTSHSSENHSEKWTSTRKLKATEKLLERNDSKCALIQTQWCVVTKRHFQFSLSLDVLYKHILQIAFQGSV